MKIGNDFEIGITTISREMKANLVVAERSGENSGINLVSGIANQNKWLVGNVFSDTNSLQFCSPIQMSHKCSINIEVATQYLVENLLVSVLCLALDALFYCRQEQEIETTSNIITISLLPNYPRGSTWKTFKEGLRNGSNKKPWWHFCTIMALIWH